jgi:hypothetical protein
VTVDEMSAASVVAQQRSGPSKVGQRAPQLSSHTEMTQSGADYTVQSGASLSLWSGPTREEPLTILRLCRPQLL